MNVFKYIRPHLLPWSLTNPVTSSLPDGAVIGAIFASACPQCPKSGQDLDFSGHMSLQIERPLLSDSVVHFAKGTDQEFSSPRKSSTVLKQTIV